MFKNLVRWIASHQVTSFFIITFMITWGLGFSYIAVMREKYLFLPLMFLATCGPGLAGIIVAGISRSGAEPGKNRFRWLAFIISWIVVTTVFIANQHFVNRGPVSPPLVILVAVSSLPVAFIVNLVYTRFPVIRGFKLRSQRSGVTIMWIIIAFLVFPLLTIIAALTGKLLGQDSPSLSALPASGFGLVLLFVVKFLSQFFYFNGTGEEAGWRGFALPRLQAQTSPLVAGLLLALVWVPWHLFLWIGEGREVMTLSFWVSSYLLHIPSAMILCWCYNRSNGSLLAAGIAHASANTVVMLVQPLEQNILIIVFFVFTAAIILADRMWKRLPEEHPAVQSVI
ncbi:MAG: CPBP family glutamic-type intramembrane protease [Bacteroidales bacterium]|jgi:membrane protease YdiL (CAAX protease family)|nr:CPBP family glutamic-type intramembrane protease [Bacteroidales bacterium]